MTGSEPRPRVTRLGTFVRRWRFDRNPLRRGVDRIETTVVALLVVAFLAGSPFAALAAGAWVHGMARQAQLAQEASRSQVTAVAITVTPVTGARRVRAGQPAPEEHHAAF